MPLEKRMFQVWQANGSNLRSKLIRVFLLQLLLISLLVIGGVFAANFIVKNVLIHRALEGEATFYWNKYQKNPAQPLPSTLNLTGYLSGVGNKQAGVPAALSTLAPGMHHIDFAGQRPIIYVSDKFGRRLYLVFDEKSVSRLALLFGLLPLAFVLVIFYLLAWFGYRQSSKAVSPLVKLANQVDAIDVGDDKWAPLDAKNFDLAHNVEVDSMVTAINHFIERLRQFVEREREFTRHASHELRTPIAVLKGALEVLERRHPDLSDPALARMERTLGDMQGLTETLLLLARDESNHLPSSLVNMEPLAHASIDMLGSIHHEKSLVVEVISHASLVVDAPEKVLEILVGNLLRNAFNYTLQGSIHIVLYSNSMEIIDSGIGMKKEQLQAVTRPFYRAEEATAALGHGLGMTIVQRLCARYNWQLSISSSHGQGTRVKVTFR
jgi:signal transduction histidine kinase